MLHNYFAMFTIKKKPAPRALENEMKKDLAIALTSSRESWLSLSPSISLKTFADGAESLMLINSTSKCSVAPEI